MSRNGEVGIERFIGDDVDNALNGICTIQCAASTTHNLDALNVLNANRQHVEIDSTLSQLKHRTAIDHKQRATILGIEKHVVIRNIVQAAEVNIIHAIGLFGHDNTRDET